NACVEPKGNAIVTKQLQVAARPSTTSPGVMSTAILPAQSVIEGDGRLMMKSPFDRRAFLLASGATAVAVACRPAYGEPVWSPQPEVRLTAEVLPPELISGAGFEVGREVTTHDFLNRYTVTSDYGTFIVPCDAMLRRLEREIAAIRGLAEIQQSAAF